MAEIFTRKFSEVSGGRFDPQFYREAIFNNIKRLKERGFQKLKSIITESSYGILPPSDSYNPSNPITFIRATELKEDLQIDFNNALKVPHNFLLPRATLQKDDILIAVKGATIASKKSVAFVNSNITNTIFNGSIFRIRVDKTKYIPKCLAYVLDTSLLKMQCKSNLVANNAVDYLDKSVLENLLIPLPPLSTQQHIIDLMDKAYKAKKEKENKAKELLDSIDSYLLEELGIILPLRANNTLDSRIYTQKISALSGSRFDANYHQKYYRDLEKSLHCSPYPLVNLASLINNFKKGIEVGSSEYSQNKEIPFIRVSDITNNGIDFDNVQKFISASLFENLKAYKPKQNELLYSKDGTVGICLEADVSRDYIISGGILRLELKAEVDKDFLCFLLGSYMINVFANRVSIGAVIKHLNIGEFLNLKIPLPPLAIQTQIASRLKNSKFQALSLEKEAKEILNKAKIDVETLLLSAGGGGVTLAFSFEAFIQTHYFDKIAKIWNEREYSVVRLGEILSFVASGSTPESKGEDYEKNGIYHFLRLVDFNDGLEIDFNNALFVKEYIYKNTLSRVQLKNNDILFGIAGSVGKVAQYKSDKMAVVNQAIAILRFQKGVFADFMCYLLASNVIQNQVQRLKRPVAQPNISIMELKGIKIPLPPLTEQERIAKEISQRKAQAKALKQEAKESLESAKKEVEHIILGG
ncbi:restriction endonuclease subunit S [Campylobacter upsaliensis]